jgi:hypothetical protein
VRRLPGHHPDRMNERAVADRRPCPAPGRWLPVEASDQRRASIPHQVGRLPSPRPDCVVLRAWNVGYGADASMASRVATSSWTGIRPLATTWPPARRSATAKGAAQTFSYTSTPAELPGSSAFAASSMSL